MQRRCVQNRRVSKSYSERKLLAGSACATRHAGNSLKNQCPEVNIQQVAGPSRPRTLTASPQVCRAANLCNPVYDSPMLGGRTNEQWIAQYSSSHQHPINRLCHTLGIPTILISVAVFVVGFFVHRLWLYALGLFVIGWILQFIGHAFEGKPPEFLSDWRFLFVGVRWWWAKINGKA